MTTTMTISKRIARNVSVDELHRHVLELGRAFNVTIDETAKAAEFSHARQDCDMRTGAIMAARIVLPRIDSVFIYTIAMHELGHCVDPLGTVGGDEVIRKYGRNVPIQQAQNMRELNLHYTCEEAAWNWARHYSLVWTDESDRAHRLGMDTYWLAYHQRKAQLQPPIPRIRSQRLGDFVKKL